MKTAEDKDREYSHLLKRQGIQKRAFRAARLHDDGSALERWLWKIAKWAPYGGMAVPSVGPDLYLLRLYLTGHGRRLHLRTSLKRQNDYDVGSGLRPYLHFFGRGDLDEEYHNHPWRVCYSLILTGGYTEYRWDVGKRETIVRKYLPGDINVIRRDDFHRVELIDPARGCWTLFFSIDRLEPSNGKDWSFLNIETGELTPWGEFVSKREVREQGGYTTKDTLSAEAE